mmetsp:Transcript_9851/g.28363  ORF Transcript_9851/g.28363 Transcript_9851/m.28363 type:complete len:116 (+) Transcript_9851:1672-2019(+)
MAAHERDPPPSRDTDSVQPCIHKTKNASMRPTAVLSHPIPLLGVPVGGSCLFWPVGGVVESELPSCLVSQSECMCRTTDLMGELTSCRQTWQAEYSCLQSIFSRLYVMSERDTNI